MRPGEVWRAAVSTVVGIGWMIFLIIFSAYENIAIFLVSILVHGRDSHADVDDMGNEAVSVPREGGRESKS